MTSTQTTRFDTARLTAVCLALFAAYPVLAHAGVAGRVQFVAGDVRVVDAQGKEQSMRKGQDVNEGDTVLSAEGASAQLKMIDGALIAVRPGTHLKLTGYQFNGKEDGTEKASLSLLKGGLRAITGAIGRTNKDRYRIDTPTATIGIRGTDHEPMVVLPAADGTAGAAPAGTYDKVNVGATVLTTQGGAAIVAPNQVGFAGSPTQAPVILPAMPSFYRTTAGNGAANAPKQQKKDAQQAAAPAPAESSEPTEPSGGDTGTQTAPRLAAIPPAQPAMAAAAPHSAPPPTGVFTAVDAGGNSLDLANQTVRTPGGTTAPLTDPIPSPSPTPAPSGSPFVELIASYPVAVDYGDGSSPAAGSNYFYPGMFFLMGTPASLTRDAAGNLVRADSSNAYEEAFGYRSSLYQTGSTMADFGKHEATGLSWGRWQGGSVSTQYQYYARDANGNFGMGADNENGEFVIGGTYSNTSALGSGSLHWVTGPSASAGFLSQVVTGTANYTSVGGTRPTDSQGNTGVFSKAALSVNFTTQTASASVDFSISGDSWNMKSDGMALQKTHFSSTGYCNAACTSTVQLTKNGTVLVPGTDTSTGTTGSISGMLTGAGMNGVALQYSVQSYTSTSGTDPVTGMPTYGMDSNVIQGAAALAGPTQDINTPFRIATVTSDWMLEDDTNVQLGPDGKPLYRGAVDGGASPVARVVEDATGLRSFVGAAYGFTPLNGDDVESTLLAATRATVSAGTAVNRDVGSTTIAGATITWGRWEGGTVDIYSGDGSTRIGTIDNTNRSMHWLSSSVLTGSYFNMPLTGTATYALAGNTRPTDLKGNTGTLGSATLSADFARAKVDAGVSVSFSSATNTSNWNMTATNVPLAGNGDFASASTMNGFSGISHTVTCSGPSCGAQAIGYIDGHIFGGGAGAIMNYNMMTKDAAGAVLNGATGLAVMKR